MKKLIIMLALLLPVAQIAAAQTTKIWIVRHAEKDKTNPANPDPDLSEDGKKRATDLLAYLATVRFDAAYSTPLKRTRQTLAPLVTQNKITVTDYQSTTALVHDIKENHLGQNIIIAGHTNTILETIEALGAKRPVAALTEDDFDFVFSITLEGKEATVTVATFGQPHHSQ